MERMSRAQRLLLVYILLELEKPRIVRRIIRQYTSEMVKHDNTYHTVNFYSSEADIPVLTDAKYPNALLLDGSRQASLIDINSGVGQYDNITMKKVDIKGHPSSAVVYLFYKGTATPCSLVAGACNFITITGYNDTSVLQPKYADDSAFRFDARDNDTDTQTPCAVLQSASEPYFGISRAGDITMLDQKIQKLGTFTDAQRPVAGTAGRWIFNTDDGMPNYDDGVNWRDINGNIT